MTPSTEREAGTLPRANGGTPPFQALLAGLRLALGAGRRDADADAVRGVRDWAGVGRLADRHRVASLLWLGVRTAGEADPRAEAALGRPGARRSARGLRQLAGLREAGLRLADAGIPMLVLKGLPLSARLFGSPLARDCVDIDLLVPPEAADAAVRALAGGGWRLVKPSFEPTPGNVRLYDRFVKDRLLVGPRGPVELHHRLTSNPFLLERPFEGLLADAATVEVGGVPFRAPGDEDLFAYLAVHGQLHRWSRLKWLCDFAALAGLMDAGRVATAVERCRAQGLALEAALGAAAALSRDCLHVACPALAEAVPDGAPARRAVRTTRRLWSRPGGGKGLKGAARRLDEARLAVAMKPQWRTLAHEAARTCSAPYDPGPSGRWTLPLSALRRLLRRPR